MIELVEAPPFVLFPVAPSRFAAAAAGVKGADNAAKPAENQVVATAIEPAAADAPDPAPDAAAAANKPVLDSFLDAYAKYIFAIRSLQTRQGQLSGPLRMDVSPGSTVRIEGLNDDYLGAGGLGQYFYATVMRVTVSIDCEAGQAGTAFHVAYIRDSDENVDDATSIATHPLYNNVFNGYYLARASDDDVKAIVRNYLILASAKYSMSCPSSNLVNSAHWSNPILAEQLPLQSIPILRYIFV